MIDGAPPPPRQGIVVSDLHLFARRSRGEECFHGLRSELASVDLLVLNGDIFDFRWSTLRDHEATAAAATDWLQRLAAEYPRCEVHYVLGNHDCLALFRDRLPALRAAEPRFHWHDHHLRLGTAFFLHGDCVGRRMDLAALRAYRRSWERDRQRGAAATTAYLAADRLGLSHWVHGRWFPRQETVERVAHHLDHVQADWRRRIRDCYFGHTHLAFADHAYEGVRFHNTGSAIRDMEFSPIRFAIPAGDGAPCGSP